MKIKVRFAKEGTEVIAIFQQHARDKSNGQQRISYSHANQHSHGDPEYFAKLKPAEPGEYASLLWHLVNNCKYNDLQITNRQTFTCHRPPTEAEIKFGEGATHYRDFTAGQIGVNGRGRLKEMFKADDGLMYSRRYNQQPEP